MADSFFEKPILNSPYEYPGRHWKLDEDGQPTNEVLDHRRPASYITPVPKPKKRKTTAADAQRELYADEEEEQRYRTIQVINDLREQVDAWRKISDPNAWRVTPETQRLHSHWRTFDFQSRRPFFCQIEAAETLIWLTEVAPQDRTHGKRFLDYLDAANQGANPDLARLALKMATGAGKTIMTGPGGRPNEGLEAARTGNWLAENDLVICRRDKLSRNMKPGEPGSLHEKLLATDWDLVVVDGAHRMSATFFRDTI